MNAPLEIMSQRLLLRPMVAGDRDLYVRLYSDPMVMRHIATPRSVTEADASFDRACALQHDLQQSQHQDLQHDQPAFPPRWIAELRETGQGIGLLCLIADTGSSTAETGVMLLPEAQRRGLAAEALATLVRAAFERGWAAMWARHAPANQAMARVLAGLGFEAEAFGDDGDCRWRLEAGRPEKRPADSGLPRPELARSGLFG